VIDCARQRLLVARMWMFGRHWSTRRQWSCRSGWKNRRPSTSPRYTNSSLHLYQLYL